MNHDITHCTGKDVVLEKNSELIVCPKRESCVRYKAHLEAPTHTMLSYIKAYGCIKNNCNLYWKEARNEKDNVQ